MLFVSPENFYFSIFFFIDWTRNRIRTKYLFIGIEVRPFEWLGRISQSHSKRWFPIVFEPSFCISQKFFDYVRNFRFLWILVLFLNLFHFRAHRPYFCCRLLHLYLSFSLLFFPRSAVFSRSSPYVFQSFSSLQKQPTTIPRPFSPPRETLRPLFLFHFSSVSFLIPSGFLAQLLFVFIFSAPPQIIVNLPQTKCQCCRRFSNWVSCPFSIQNGSCFILAFSILYLQVSTIQLLE